MNASKEQHAVGDLWANAAQLHQFFTSLVGGHSRQSPPVDFFVENVACCCEQVWCAKAKFALAQFFFAARCDCLDSRKHKCRIVAAGSNRLSVPLAQQRDHLPDLHDLLGRREDERREAFPVILPKQTQARESGDGVAHRFVVRKCGEHLVEVNLQLQIFLEPRPVADRLGHLGGDAVLGRAQPNPAATNHAFPRLTK